MRFALRTRIMGWLRVPCGAFGGQMPDNRTRWCTKRFGHEDSCAFDWVEQPLEVDRRRARGWTR